MSFQRLIFKVVLPGLLVAGCSSDSSPFFPGEGVDQAPPPATQLPITATNARAAAKEAYLAAVKASRLADVGATIGGSVGGGLSKPTAPSLKAGGIPELVRMAPFGPTVIGCTLGGTITISGDLASPTTLSVGDIINLEYDICDTGVQRITGRVESTVDQYSEDPDNPELFQLGLDLRLINYQVTTGTDVETLNGDAGVVVDATGTPTTLASSVAGSSITFDDNSSSTTLTNYSDRQVFTINGAVIEFSVDTRGTVDSTDLTAAVTYSTPVLLTGIEFEFPSAGELLVVGDNSSVRVVALDSTNVRLEIDSDGDGEVDVSVETTWTDISS